MFPAYKPSPKSTLISILIAVGLVLTFMVALMPNVKYMLMALIFALIAYYIVSLDVNIMPKVIHSKVLSFIGIMWFCCVLCSVVCCRSDILNLGNLEMLLYGVSVAIVVSYKTIPTWPIKLAFYIIFAYLANRCIIQHAAVDEIFFYSGNAYMISVLLSIAVLIQLIEWRDNKKIDIIPPILIFILSFYSWSRTGLICALLYLLTVLFFVIRAKMKIGKIGLFLVFFIVVGGISYYVWGKFSNILNENDLFVKFGNYGLNTTGRSDIWSDYFKRLDFISIIFGGNFVDSLAAKEFDNDLHNSYIQLHSSIGIVSLWVLYYLFKSGRVLFRKDSFMFWLFIVMVLRGFFDYLFFWKVYDFAIYIFVIYALQRSSDDYISLDDIKLVLL